MTHIGLDTANENPSSSSSLCIRVATIGGVQSLQFLAVPCWGTGAMSLHEDYGGRVQGVLLAHAATQSQLLPRGRESNSLYQRREQHQRREQGSRIR